jgi:phosphatidylglycerophosphatase A
MNPSPLPAATGSAASLSRLGEAMLTTFGLGHLRPASGTWGSMPPVLLAGGLIAVGLGPGGNPIVYNIVLGVVAVVFTLACLVYGNQGEARFGKKDPGQVVADETAGQSLALLFIPAAAVANPLDAVLILVTAFLAFRVLDILKIWPAYQLQNLPSGLGIVIDDLVSGLQALVVVQIVAYVLIG